MNTYHEALQEIKALKELVVLKKDLIDTLRKAFLGGMTASEKADHEYGKELFHDYMNNDPDIDYLKRSITAYEVTIDEIITTGRYDGE